MLVTPGAVKARGEQTAKDYIGSFTLGAGQFCTKPGLLLLLDSHGLERTLVEAAQAVPAQPTLNDRIAAA